MPDIGELLEFEVPFWAANEKLPDPDLVLFYKGLEDRDIWLDSEIDFAQCGFIIKYIQYLNRREAENRTPIRIHIMSPGGALNIMFTLYHTIVNSDIPIHTINEGDCHSAAFTIFLAGSTRTMNPDAHFIVHEGSGGVGGSYREAERAMDYYKKEVVRMKEIIVSRTSLDMEEIQKHLNQDQDWYINYDLAKELKIITE